MVWAGNEARGWYGLGMRLGGVVWAGNEAKGWYGQGMWLIIYILTSSSHTVDVQRTTHHTQQSKEDEERKH